MTKTKLTLCEIGDPGLPAHETYSPFCMKANRTLRVAGLRYERRHGQQPAIFAALNPAKQVPVLLRDDRPIADSSRILEVAEELSGRLFDAELSPKDRAEAWLFEELGDTALNGFLVASRWADDRNWPLTKEAYFGAMPWPVKAIVPGRLRAHVVTGLVARDVWRAGEAACWERFEKLLDRLDARAPRSGFWMGPRLGVADLGLFGQLHGLRTPLTAWQRDRVAERAHVSAWLDRVDAATSVRGETRDQLASSRPRSDSALIS